MGGESPSHPRVDSISAALSSTRLRGAYSPCSAETTLETRSSRGPRAHSTEFRSVSSWKETLRRRRHRGNCPEKHPESHERASDSDLVGSRIVWRFSKQGGRILAEELLFRLSAKLRSQLEGARRRAGCRRGDSIALTAPPPPHLTPLVLSAEGTSTVRRRGGGGGGGGGRGGLEARWRGRSVPMASS